MRRSFFSVTAAMHFIFLCLSVAANGLLGEASAQTAARIVPALVKYGSQGGAVPWYWFEDPFSSSPFSPSTPYWFETYSGEEICKRVMGYGMIPSHPNCGGDFPTYSLSQWRARLNVNSLTGARSVACEAFYSFPTGRPYCDAAFPNNVFQTSSAQIRFMYVCPDATWTRRGEYCYKLVDDADSDDCPLGNPIDPSFGSKHQIEEDGRLWDAGRPMRLLRTFSSRSSVALKSHVGQGWMFVPWDRRLILVGNLLSPDSVTAVRDSGVSIAFFPGTGGSYVQTTRRSLRIARVASEWILADENNLTLEAYDSAGRLLRVESGDGRREFLTYSDGSTLKKHLPEAAFA